jgi:hypothetical protein
MSNPSKPSEELTTTATRNCGGNTVTVELIIDGALGQFVLPSLAMHTRPTEDDPTLKNTFTECFSDPLVPVTATV